MSCFLDPLRAFAIDADQWEIAVQDEGKLRKTAEQRKENTAAEKSEPRLRYAVVCLNLKGRTKERRVQNKRARANSPAIVNTSQSPRTLSLRNLVLGYECGRVFPAGVGPGSLSRGAANWLSSRFSRSVETRRRHG